MVHITHSTKLIMSFLLQLRILKMAESRDEAVDMVEKALELVGLVPAETLGRLPHSVKWWAKDKGLWLQGHLLFKTESNFGRRASISC